MPKKRKGSSRAGRPRKDGDRYPSGKLKPMGPNERVLARRKVGDASAGEHPMDFALSQNWITESQHRDAKSYRDAYNRAHIGGPRMSHGGLCEVPPSDQLRLNWSQLSDAEITEIFDRVFSGDPMPGDREAIEAKALGRWKLINKSLSGPEREELFMVCVLGSWPLWMPKQGAGKDLGVKDAEKKARLMGALGGLSRSLRPAKAKEDTIMAVPFVRSRKNRGEQPVVYVTSDGLTVQPESEHGRVFEVAILRRRA